MAIQLMTGEYRPRLPEVHSAAPAAGQQPGEGGGEGGHGHLPADGHQV